MNQCKDCGTENKDGALMCENCGEVLEVQVASGAGQVAFPAVKPSPPGAGQACRLVEAGKVTDKEFELPQGDFEFLVGRPDLDQGIIPDVDLTKYGGKVTIEGEAGYTFSRKQAVISHRTGRLYLKAIGSAKTMHRKQGAVDWNKIGKEEEVELQVGDRIRFGGTEGYLIFEVV